MTERPEAGTSRTRLEQLHRAFTDAFGDASHPLVTLMRAALASSSDSVCAAVVAHVEGERAKTQEALALAAVARELDADTGKILPHLFLSIDVEAVRPIELQTIDQALRRDAAIRISHRFMREPSAMIDGSLLAGRILLPAHSAAIGHVEAASRILRDQWRQWVMPTNDARAAMLAAAVERNSNAKK